MYIIHFRCLSMCMCLYVGILCVCVCVCVCVCTHTREHILSVFHPLRTIRCLAVDAGMRRWPPWSSGPSGLPEPAGNSTSWPVVVTKSQTMPNSSASWNDMCCQVASSWEVLEDHEQFLKSTVLWTERRHEWMQHKRVGFCLNCKLEKSNLERARCLRA